MRIPIVANGDICTFDDARRVLAESRADAIMIGRGSYGRPWFPNQVRHFLEIGERLSDPPLSERLAIVLEHYDAILTLSAHTVRIRNGKSKRRGLRRGGKPSRSGLERFAKHRLRSVQNPD